MSEVDQEEAVLLVEQDDLDEVRSLAKEHSVELTVLPARGIEPVTTVTLIVLGTAAAVGAIAYLVDQKKGGQVIDLREGAPATLYRSKELIYGLVVIITREGVVRVEVREPQGMFGTAVNALSGLTSDMVSAGNQEVVEAVQGALGDQVAVVVEELEAGL
ncbi:hypothetical protein [Nocardia sp. MW-W600-9]